MTTPKYGFALLDSLNEPGRILTANEQRVLYQLMEIGERLVFLPRSQQIAECRQVLAGKRAGLLQMERQHQEEMKTCPVGKQARKRLCQGHKESACRLQIELWAGFLQEAEELQGAE